MAENTPKQPKRPRGRPTTYTPDLAGRLCERVALGEPMSAVCKEAGMPSLRTVYQWQCANEEFARALALAREQRADARADQIHDLIEQVKAGKIDAHSARVAIEGHRWLASREQPRKYGDRVMSEVAISGSIHAESTAATAEWIKKILASDDRSNVIRLLPHKEPGV